MAGLLDLLTARISPAYYQRQQQLEDQKAFQGLLGEYQKPQYQPQDAIAANAGPTQTSTVQGRGGLLDPATQQEFLYRAAAIPGYDQLAGAMAQNLGAGQRQGQVGQQQLDQQAQKQLWYRDNMDLKDLGNLQQQQPLVDARTGAANASAYSSNASGDRTRQGIGIDAGDYARRERVGLLDMAERQTPQEKSDLQVQQSDKIGYDTSRRATEAENANGERWNAALDSYAQESLDARGGLLGVAGGAVKARLETKRNQLVTLLAKQMTGGTAEPNPGVIEQAESMIPQLGWGDIDENFKARLSPLRYQPKPVRGPSTVKPPPGFKAVR